MRKLAVYVSLALSVVAFLAFTPAHAAYLYSRSLTVTSTPSIASGTNINFPLLVSSTLTSFESTSTGGRFYSAKGYDHAYATSTQNCLLGNFLNYENESYVSSTGALVDWVNVPSLSTSTQIFICYGNPTISSSQANAASTWNSNFKAVWHLDDGGVGTTIDSTSNGNSGAQLNGPTSVAGEIGQGTFFSSGSSSYVDFGFPASLQISSAFTMSTWVNSASLSFVPIFYNQFSNASVCGIAIALNNSGSDEVDVNINGATYDHPYAANIDDGNWHYLAVTISGSNVAVYVDSSTLATDTGAPTPCYTNAGTEHTRINAINALTKFGTEDFDEMHVLATALTPSWIATEYNNQSSPSTFYALGAESSLSAPVISSFSASPSIVAAAGTSTFAWNVSGASLIAITPGTFSTSTLVGSMTVNPTSTTTYTLTATNGSSGATSTATTTITIDSTPPTTPSSLTANTISVSEIDLSWASSTDSGGSGLSYYEILRCVGSCTPNAQVATSSGASYHDTGLSAGTNYTYAIIAVDGVGNVSGASVSANATTQSNIVQSQGSTVGVAAGYIMSTGNITSSSLISNTSSSLGVVSSVLPSIVRTLASLNGQFQAISSEINNQASSIFSRNLSFGDSGPDVRVLQNFLIKANAGSAATALSKHGTTDFFGSLTLAALQEFQKKMDITPAAGYFGPITRGIVETQL